EQQGAVGCGLCVDHESLHEWVCSYIPPANRMDNSLSRAMISHLGCERFVNRHPGTVLAPYPGSARAPAFVTIPDNAFRGSGMTKDAFVKRLECLIA
ncbi:MAG: hypothetical protein WCC96_05320, partial [Rhodomicrobium sp.]